MQHLERNIHEVQKAFVLQHKMTLPHPCWVSQRAGCQAKKKLENTQDAVPFKLLISIAYH